MPHPFYNGVVCSDLPGSGSAALAAETVGHFRGKGVPAFIWWQSSAEGSRAWERILREQGLELNRELPGMAAEIARLAFPDVRAYDVRRVTDEAALAVWARTFIEGYGCPAAWAEPFYRLYRDVAFGEGPLRCYLVYADGVPVAASMLFLAAGVAGIYDVATLPMARGRGYGGVVTAAPLLDARALGYRIAVLQSSTMGLPVYERLGFRTVCQIEHFSWKDPDGPRS